MHSSCSLGRGPAVAVPPSPRPWIDVFAVEKFNIAVTESDLDPKVRKICPKLFNDCATCELSMRAWNGNATDLWLKPASERGLSSSRSIELQPIAWRHLATLPSIEKNRVGVNWYQFIYILTLSSLNSPLSSSSTTSRENCQIMVKEVHGNFPFKTVSCRKIKSVFRVVKLCFKASWGLKGLHNLYFCSYRC